VAQSLKTILCVDDDPTTLELRRQVLETAPYLVLTALSGPEAFKLISDGKTVDAIVLDYHMPSMKGDEVAEQLKRLYPELPVIVMSGFPEIPEMLLRMTDGFVRKGDDPEVLIEAISVVLTRLLSAAL
jgi:CheY-like chemotaxis protein